MEAGYATPEEAALAGWDPRYASVVAVRFGVRDHADAGGVADEDHALVELATNEPPLEYPYFIHVTRENGRWMPDNDHN